MVLNLALHICELLLHLVELSHLLLDFKLLDFLCLFLVLDLLLGSPSLGRGLEEVVGTTVPGADGPIGVEGLSNLGVELDVLFGLDFDLLVPLVDSLIHPNLKFFA